MRNATEQQPIPAIMDLIAGQWRSQMLQDGVALGIYDALSALQPSAATAIERTQSDLKRAKSEGKPLGRPSTLTEKQKQDVREDLATGMSVSATARKFATSRQTIMRVRAAGSRSVRT